MAGRNPASAGFRAEAIPYSTLLSNQYRGQQRAIAAVFQAVKCTSDSDPESAIRHLLTNFSQQCFELGPRASIPRIN
jgi:hypothetical protein